MQAFTIFAVLAIFLVTFPFLSTSVRTSFDRGQVKVVNGGNVNVPLFNSNKNESADTLKFASDLLDNDFGKDKKDRRKKLSPGPRPIPNTNLKTRTFYKIGMKRFPFGFVTPTGQKNVATEYRYIQIDNNRDHARKFEIGGDLFLETEWEFVPVSSNNNYRWYKLRNRARPREYATWSVNEFLDEKARTSFLILDSRYPGQRSRTEFLFRPVPINENRTREDKTYYQLKLKDNRKCNITWSEREYAPEAYYLQVDCNDDEMHMRRYENGNDRFNSTLFTIELAEKEDIDDEEDMEDNAYNDNGDR